jgi:cysteine-rich repeat protein
MKIFFRAFLLVCSFSLLPFPLYAVVYIVDTNTDEAGAGFQVCSAAANDCSLRGAVIKANTDAVEDEISIPAGTYTVNIDRVAEAQNAGALTETEGDIDIIQPLKVTGAGADQTTIQGAFTADPNKQDRIFMVNLVAAGGVEFSGLTVTGGRGDRGGGIWGFGSPVTVNDCVISGNQALAEGGGLSSDNAAGVDIRISNSTFSGNSAGGRGGGLFFETADAFLTNTTFSGNTATGDGTNNTGGGAIDVTTGKMTLISSTLVGNSVTTAGSIGGGIRNAAAGGAVFTIKNTILANNTVAGAAQNCANTGNAPVSQGGSISSDASCLASFLSGAGDLNGIADPIVNTTLTNNGGRTPTHLLPSGSQAIDLAVDCNASGDGALTMDQRGFNRPADGDGNGTATCDAGAVEVGCGNLNVDSGEECDDGNVTNGDGCSSTCQTEGGGGGACGDNNLDAGEQCDDGNTLAGDGCSATCTNEGAAACGDDILQAGEECDDGNNVSGDGCSETCDDEGGGGCSLIRR